RRDRPRAGARGERRRRRAAPPAGAHAEGAPLRRRREAAHARPGLEAGRRPARDRARDGHAGRACRGRARPARRRRRMTLIGPELAARVLERALAHGGDLGEVYAEDRYGFAIGLDDSKLERPQTGSERGAAVRVVQGDATYYGYVDGLAEPDLLRVADSVAQAVRAGDARRPAALEAAVGKTLH